LSLKALCHLGQAAQRAPDAVETPAHDDIALAAWFRISGFWVTEVILPQGVV
jgi:hypothetical protein